MLKCYIRHRMANKRIDDIKELMTLSGVGRNTVNKLFRNKGVETTKIETLMKLCDVLECKLSELVEYQPDSYKPPEERS